MKRITKLFTALALALGLTTAAQAAKTVTPVFLLNYTTGTVSGWTNQSQNGGGDLNKVTSGGISFASTGNGGGGNFKNAFAGSSGDTFQDGTYVDIFGVSHTSLIDEVKASLALPAGTDFTADVYNTGIYQGAKVNATGQLTGLDPAKKYVIYVGTGKATSNAANRRAAFKLAAADCGTIDSLQYVVTQGHNDGQDPTTAATTYTTFTTDQYVGPKTDSLMIVRFVGKPNSSGAFKFRMSYGDGDVYRDGINFIAAAEIDEVENYSATVDSNKNWSDITWSSEITDPSSAVLNLTVENNATITMDGTFAYKKINVTGDATFVAADSLYEDGCWQKTLLGGYFTATDTIAFGAMKSGFAGAYAQTANGITLRAQNKEVISINIAGGSDGGSGGDSPKDNLVSGEGFYGIAPTLGDSWNNINRQWQSGGNQTIKIEGPNAYDGTQVIKRETMSLSATGKNTWQCGSISNPFLRGYLDDGNGVTVEVHGIPYTEYDVIVYSTSDSSVLLAPVTINGAQYTFADGVTKPGSTVWGAGQYATPEIGKNALRVNDCTGDTLTINAKRASSPDGRATLCAVQVINKGEVVLRETYAATIPGSTAFEDINWGKTFEEGQLNEATITVDDSSTDEVEISFANPAMYLGKLEIISDRDVKLTADEPFSNVGQFIITGCTAKVTYNYPVKTLVMTTDGKIAYTGGAGTDESAAGITFVKDGALTLDGRDGEAAAYFIGDTYRENTDASTITFTNAQVYCKSWAGLAIGTTVMTIAGDSQVEAEKCILSQGTVGQVSEITIKDDSAVTITGENDVDSNQASIMFGHWDGPSTFTLQDNATFTAEKTQVLVGKTGNKHTINLNGGTFTTKGIKASASATGTNTLNLNGGSLVLGEVGISSYGTTKIQVNVTEDSTITSTAAMVITQPFTVADGKTLTIDATDGDIVLMQTTGLTPDNVTVAGGNVYYGFTVGINDLGKFTIPQGYTADQIKLFDGAGNPVAFTENEGVLEFEWKYTGGACLWDYEFNEASGQTPKGSGRDSTGLNLDGDRSQAMKDAGEYATNIVETIEGTVTNIALRVPNRPWRDVSSWPTTATFMFYGTMVGKDKAYQIAFGSKNNSGNQLFFATKSVADGTVDLCYSVAGAAPTILCTMNVPNAQKANHLYAVVLKDDGNGNTVVNTYLDGKLLQPYTHTGALTLGNGFQIASGHGGVAAGGYGRPSDDDPATMDWLRVYDVELSAKAMEALADIYYYVSENGEATRTVTSEDTAWVADDKWTQVTTEGSVTTNAPFANTMVELTVNEDTTLALNLTEKANYEALEIKGNGALTLTGAEEAVVPAVSGTTTIGTDVTVAYDAITFGNVTIADGKTLTFDFAGLDLTQEFKSRSIKLTGTAVLGEESQVAVENVPESAGRTTELVYDTHTQQYSLKITVEDLPFVYNGGWTWAGETIDESVVDAHTEILIEVQGGELEKAIDREYLVTGGTLKAESYSGAQTITVQGGAFDVNGKKDAAYNVVLAGGKLMNGSTDIGTGSKQFTSISVTANSEVGGTGEFGYILQGWGANTLDLNGATLTKVDGNTFSLCNCTVTNGVIVVTGGTLGIANTAVTFTDDATLTIGASGTLNVGTTLTIASIAAAEGATVNVNGQRGLAFTGSGTIVATLTDDEYEAGAADIFTGDGTLKVMYNGVDITDKCTISGGQITAIEYPVAKIVSGETTAYYYALNAALEAAEAGQTVTLLKDIETATPAAFVIDKSITLDFGTSTITKTVANDWVFQIAKDAEVTFAGTTGGIVHYPGVLNKVNPASMIQVLGKLTVEGGAYKSDYTIFKVDEDDAATHTAKGELVVNGGTFTIKEQEGTIYTGLTYAVMNWSKATLNGGTFTGDITTLSNDGNAVSKAGETIVGTIEGAPVYKLQVMGSTYENVPKIKGVALADVTLVKSSSITDPLFLVESGEYVTVTGNPEAKIGTTYYLTFAEALEAATAGQTVELLKSITTDKAAAFAIAKNITVDFGTSTITKTVANDWVFDITTNVTVVFKGTTGGITQTASNLNPDSPASMIRNKGILTVEGGVYTSDFCIIKNDEDPGAGELTVTGGTFNMVRTTGGYEGLQMALMNWATATISGGTWNGTIGTRSCDRNNVSKAGATTIGTLEGSPSYLLYVGYEGDTTWTNMPKIAGVAIADVTLDKNPSVTDELEKVQDGDWVTVQKKSGGTEVVPGEPVHCDTLLEAEKATVALDENQKTLDPEQQTEYTNLFTKVIIGSQETGYTVSFLPTEDTVTSVSNAVVEADKELLSEITPGESVEVSIETKPGLYYSVAVSETLSTEELVKGEGERIMGTGEPLELEVTTPEEATKCFYQIMVNVSDTKVGETK